MERKFRNALAALIVGYVCMAHAAMAADDGQTRPKVNTNATNSSVTPVDLIPSTSASGNVKGISCALSESSGNLPGARIKFTVDGGAVQTVDLHDFLTPGTVGGVVTGYTGWVPFNVRFASSILVQMQKTSSAGGSINCAASWALD